MPEDWRKRAEEQGFSVGPMRLITELPDGSRIEPTDLEIVPMGDVFAHRQLTYAYDGDTDRPACRVVFEVRDGVPVCVTIQLGSTESGSPVRAKHLTEIKLDNLRDDAYAAAGVFVRNPDGGGYARKFGPGRFREDRKRVERATERRKVTPEFLSRVAEIHNNAPHGGRLEAVRAAFTPTPSERTALRWIAAARMRDLIP
jgi:hypothetical protein